MDTVEFMHLFLQHFLKGVQQTNFPGDFQL